MPSANLISSLFSFLFPSSTLHIFHIMILMSYFHKAFWLTPCCFFSVSWSVCVFPWTLLLRLWWSFNFSSTVSITRLKVIWREYLSSSKTYPHPLLCASHIMTHSLTTCRMEISENLRWYYLIYNYNPHCQAESGYSIHICWMHEYASLLGVRVFGSSLWIIYKNSDDCLWWSGTWVLFLFITHSWLCYIIGEEEKGSRKDINLCIFTNDIYLMCVFADIISYKLQNSPVRKELGRTEEDIRVQLD